MQENKACVRIDRPYRAQGEGVIGALEHPATLAPAVLEMLEEPFMKAVARQVACHLEPGRVFGQLVSGLES